MTIGSVFARARVSPVCMAGLTACPEVTRACVRERTANETFYIYTVVNTGDDSGQG